EVINKVRIREESHVKHQIDGKRQAVFVTKTHNGNHHIEFTACCREFLNKVASKCMDSMIGSIDDHISQVPYRLEQLLFCSDCFEQIVCGLDKRMWPARL